MKFLKNRTVIGVICIALSLIICFAITPLFNATKNSTANVVRLKNDLKIGQEITAKDIEVVEIGSYNLPSEILKRSEDVVGKYAASEMKKNEFVMSSKISDTPASENAYLYGLTGEKRAISITIPSFAGGLSGKLISGDIVSVIAVDYMEQGETVVPDELQYVEVIAVTDKHGNDEETTTVKPDGEEETSLPETVTLLVTPLQANILAELEANGEIHLSLVYRGIADNAKKFIAAQEKLITELEEKKREDSEREKDKEYPAQSEIPENNNPGDTNVRGADNSKPENPTLDEVIIIPNNEETEVNSNAESV